MNIIEIRNKLESEDNMYYVAQAHHGDGLGIFCLRDIETVVHFGTEGLTPSPRDFEELLESFVEREVFESLESIHLETALKVFKEGQAGLRLEQANIPELNALLEEGTTESILALIRITGAIADLVDECDYAYNELLEEMAA